MFASSVFGIILFRVVLLKQQACHLWKRTWPSKCAQLPYMIGTILDTGCVMFDVDYPKITHFYDKLEHVQGVKGDQLINFEDFWILP